MFRDPTLDLALLVDELLQISEMRAERTNPRLEIDDSPSTRYSARTGQLERPFSLSTVIRKIEVISHERPRESEARPQS